MQFLPVQHERIHVLPDIPFPRLPWATGFFYIARHIPKPDHQEQDYDRVLTIFGVVAIRGDIVVAISSRIHLRANEPTSISFDILQPL